MTSGVVTSAGVVPGGITSGGILPTGPGVGWAVLGFGLGMLAGAAGRVLLRRLRRGTRVPPPWLEVVVGVPWAGVVGAAGAGMLGWPWLPLLLGCALTAVASAGMAGFLVARSVRDRRDRGGGAVLARPAVAPYEAAALPRSRGPSGAPWRRGARRAGRPSGSSSQPSSRPSSLPPAELPLGPPMLGSAWLVVFVAALVGGVSGAVGPMGGG